VRVGVTQLFPDGRPLCRLVAATVERRQSTIAVLNTLFHHRRISLTRLGGL
jgi:hypothetical protein